MKRQRQSESHTEEDRLSDLPDCVLLHIMKFMNTKQAVQTCILSTRWKDLWKHLTNLKLHSSDFTRLYHFRKFVSWVLSCRDGTISLHSLDFMRHGCIEPQFLNRVMRYAVSHNVQQLTISVILGFRHNFRFLPSIFSCKSLTFLKLSIRGYTRMARLPKSLELPALESLHLMCITFTASDNQSANPFSGCKMLDTLVIENCYLDYLELDAKVLCISNSKLSSLTIDGYPQAANKIELSTPNLSSLTVRSNPICQLSTCSPLFPEEVNIDVDCFNDISKSPLVLISWLQVLANVKIMTLSLRTLKMLNDISTMTAQPPCFDRLKSLKVKTDSFPKLSGEEVSRIVEYLLQNSLPASIDIMNC